MSRISDVIKLNIYLFIGVTASSEQKLRVVTDTYFLSLMGNTTPRAYSLLRDGYNLNHANARSIIRLQFNISNIHYMPHQTVHNNLANDGLTFFY
jgi:hypothetical protein